MYFHCEVQGSDRRELVGCAVTIKAVVAAETYEEESGVRRVVSKCSKSSKDKFQCLYKKSNKGR